MIVLVIFHNVYYSTNRATDSTNFAALISFKASPMFKTYETNFQSFLDVLGTIGGIYELMHIFCLFLIKILKYMFSRNLISVKNNKINRQGNTSSFLKLAPFGSSYMLIKNFFL